MNTIKMTLSSENIHRLCKVCLEEKTSSISLSATIQLSNSPSTPIKFCDILAKLVPDTLPEEYNPNLICMNCIEQLNAVFLFLIKYEESVRILKEFAKFSESTEQQDDNDVENVLNNVENTTTDSTNKQRLRKRVDNNKQKLHLCPICTKEFTALELRKHVHTHKGLKKYLNIPREYKVTPKTRFYTERHLNRENSTIFAQKQPLHKCPYCNGEFSANHFRLHADQHRDDDDFPCDQCERVFNRLNHLNMHRLKHMKEYPYKCDYCSKGFVIKKNYDYHLLTHTETELPYKCEHCMKRFANPLHLSRHVLIHTENVTYSVKYRVCRCRHCLRTFKDKDEMNGHRCVPLPQKAKQMHTCKICKKVFSHYSSLYNHRLKIHGNARSKILCSVCGKYVSNIYNHMTRHSNTKPFKCNQCEKSFSSKPQLKQHLLVHSGIKPYVCSCCGKTFNNLYNLQVHERTHKGDKCHKCMVCGKAFLEKSYLKKHLNIHQKNV